jgi:hypothetical protein
MLAASPGGRPDPSTDGVPPGWAELPELWLALVPDPPEPAALEVEPGPDATDPGAEAEEPFPPDPLPEPLTPPEGGPPLTPAEPEPEPEPPELEPPEPPVPELIGLLRLLWTWEEDFAC